MPSDHDILITSSNSPRNRSKGILWMGACPMFFNDPEAVTVDEIIQRGNYPGAPPLSYDAFIKGQPVKPDFTLDLKNKELSLSLRRVYIQRTS